MTCPIIVYRIPVTLEEYELIRKFIYEVYNDTEVYYYNFLQALGLFLKKRCAGRATSTVSRVEGIWGGAPTASRIPSLIALSEGKRVRPGDDSAASQYQVCGHRCLLESRAAGGRCSPGTHSSIFSAPGQRSRPAVI